MPFIKPPFFQPGSKPAGSRGLGDLVAPSGCIIPFTNFNGAYRGIPAYASPGSPDGYDQTPLVTFPNAGAYSPVASSLSPITNSEPAASMPAPPPQFVPIGTSALDPDFTPCPDNRNCAATTYGITRNGGASIGSPRWYGYEAAPTCFGPPTYILTGAITTWFMVNFTIPQCYDPDWPVSFRYDIDIKSDTGTDPKLDPNAYTDIFSNWFVGMSVCSRNSDFVSNAGSMFWHTGDVLRQNSFGTSHNNLPFGTTHANDQYFLSCRQYTALIDGPGSVGDPTQWHHDASYDPVAGDKMTMIFSMSSGISYKQAVYPYANINASWIEISNLSIHFNGD